MGFLAENVMKLPVTTPSPWKVNQDGTIYRDGYVGINEHNPDEALVVDGVIGLSTIEDVSATVGYNKIFFNPDNELCIRDAEGELHVIDYDPSFVATLTDLTDVSSTDTPAKNDVLKFNGTEWVFVPEGTTFTFSIASFSHNMGSTTVEIGTGVWKAIGAISFTATYNNGPPTNAYVSLSGWTNLTMGGTAFAGPTLNTEAVNYPAVGGTRSFVLNATDGTDTNTTTRTFSFLNKRFWGVSSNSGSYTEANIEALAGSELSNSRAKTFTVTAAAGEYIVYAYPSRLGAATFYVGGFEGGFTEVQTISVTNSLGYTENYYLYRSINSGLGATTVTVS